MNILKDEIGNLVNQKFTKGNCYNKCYKNVYGYVSYKIFEKR